MCKSYKTCCAAGLPRVPLVKPVGIPAKDLTQVEFLRDEFTQVQHVMAVHNELRP
jgi:hypothetical protein